MQIDFIILTYNRANLLQKAIQSVLNQTYKNIRLLILDDNSSDNTEEVVNFFDDNRIEYIKNKQNLGMFKNWQKALSLVKGDLFHPMLGDDDIFIDNTFVEYGVKKIKKENLDALFFGMKKQINNKFIIDAPKNLQYDYLYSGLELCKNFLDYQLYCNANGLIKTEFINFLTNKEKFSFISDELSIFFNLLINLKNVKIDKKMIYQWSYNINSYSHTKIDNIYFRLKNHLYFIDKIYPIIKYYNVEDKFIDMFNSFSMYAIEDTIMNYHITRSNKIFNSILNNINKEIYIYGQGIIGIELETFLEQHNIKVLGFIDDYRKNCLKIDEIDKSKQIIIATYKKSLIHKMYKNLIANGVNYKNIVELI